MAKANLRENTEAVRRKPGIQGGFPMKKWLVAMGLVSVCSLAQAEGGVFLGLSMQLGGTISARDIGVTAKVVSSNREDRAVLGGGINVYPFGSGPTRIGIDVGAGYQGSRFGAMVGYDLLLGRPTLNAGYVNTTSR